MTAFDYAVLAIVAISAVLSVVRGLVREVLALLAWIFAFVAANLFAADLAAWLPAAIESAEMRLLAGFLGVFFAVLVAMSLVALGISRLVKKAGLGFEDRVLGALFGIARGGLIVMVLVLLAGLTSLPRQPAWRQAVLSPPLEALAVQVKELLPGPLSGRIRYN
jgi:membrane protein required for colicin V production